jgi:hypothetical protein
LAATDEGGKTRVYFTEDETGGSFVTDPGVATKWNKAPMNKKEMLVTMRRAGGVAAGGGRAFWTMREKTNSTSKEGALFTSPLGATTYPVQPWLEAPSTVGLAWREGYLYRCAEAGLHRIKVP